MPESAAHFEVRELAGGVAAIDIVGDVTAASEEALMDAYGRASGTGATTILLDFSGLDYMNSGGIGLLVMLLVRAQRRARPCWRAPSPSTTGRSSS